MSRRLRRGDLPERICALASCGKRFKPRRSDQRFHDPTCKTQAWRLADAAQAAELAAAPAPAAAQPAAAPAAPPPARPAEPIDEVLVRRLQWQRQQRGEPPVQVDPLLTVLAKVGAVQQLLRDPALKALLARYEATYDRAAGILPESELAEADLAAVLDAAVTRLGLEVLPLDGRVSVVVVVARDPERAA